MLKHFFSITALACSLLLSSCYTDDKNNQSGYYNSSYSHSEEENFKTIHGSHDIPLLEDLEVSDDNVINFDSLNGNIISTSYTTNSELVKVKNFYLKTLPQMGWEVVANEFLDNSDIIYFKRDKETLEIEFIKDEEVKTVKFFGKLDN